MKELVTQLRHRALQLPVQEVGPLVEIRRSDPQIFPHESEASFLARSRAYFDSGGQHHFAYPTDVIAFVVYPGGGCETARFGLCRYPARIEREVFSTNNKTSIRTGLTGWQLGTFCKTHFANGREHGGAKNFLRCHLSVVAILEHAHDLGLLSDICDETGFWDCRDLRLLAERVSDTELDCQDIAVQFQSFVKFLNLSERSNSPA